MMTSQGLEKLINSSLTEKFTLKLLKLFVLKRLLKVQPLERRLLG